MEPVSVILPYKQVLTQETVVAAVAKVPGDGPVVIWVHPGTRGYGDGCFHDDLGGDRVVSVRMQAETRVGWWLLRRFIVAIGMHEPGLARLIRGAVPIEPEMPTVGVGAFLGCSDLTSAAIPRWVTSIDDWAFQDCSSLESVEISDGVTSIGNHAFSNCTALVSVELPHATVVDPSAFAYCETLSVTRREA